MTAQPAPVPNDNPHIHDLVRDYVLDRPDVVWASEDIRRDVADHLMLRKAQGVETYGTPLQAHNDRDPVLDATEELLDAPVYLRQAIEEGRTEFQEEFEDALRLVCRIKRKQIAWQDAQRTEGDV